jgi:hypothetical protein
MGLRVLIGRHDRGLSAQATRVLAYGVDAQFTDLHVDRALRSWRGRRLEAE